MTEEPRKKIAEGPDEQARELELQAAMGIGLTQDTRTIDQVKASEKRKLLALQELRHQ